MPRREHTRLGPALRRAWIGYQLLLDGEMEAAGYVRRNFPDGRVLRICSRSQQVTISQIGREIGITRQGASKIVRDLQERGFVETHASSEDGREKYVVLTDSALDYLAAQHRAARTIERRLRARIGSEAFDALHDALELLGGEDVPRLREFLRSKSTEAGAD